jgi:8-oxo-dGTP pyrophosphatase MutT (NUDIX family)
VNVAELEQLIDGWSDRSDGAAMKSHELILQLLRSSDRPLSRDQFAPGHVTATGLVMHPDGDAVLLVHHRRLDRWLLPGGHVEVQDASVFDAAQREVLEETAVPAETPRLIGFDVHGIPSNGREPYHLHHDIVVAFRATSGSIVVSQESHSVAWCGLQELERYRVPGNVRLCLMRLGSGA